MSCRSAALNTAWITARTAAVSTVDSAAVSAACRPLGRATTRAWAFEYDDRDDRCAKAGIDAAEIDTGTAVNTVRRDGIISVLR